MVTSLLGGIGLFLLGMVLLTDGLRSLAGDGLRQGLTRAVRDPWSGVAAGTLATALVQSSTATTLATIGFVSAGLITFPQSIGVIVGANVGTTSTGWIVSLLGLQVSIGAVAAPLVLAGVALRLLGPARLRGAGDGLTGFGLLFVGIDMLEQGMAGVATSLRPEDLPGAGIAGRAVMVGAGFVMTVILQSSAAAIAMTIVALGAGAVDLEQAAALVIGQNIGTTATAAFAVIGAPPRAVQTALVHVLFNLVKGAVIFAILSPFLKALVWSLAPLDPSEATTLAAFNTLTALLGMLLVMPFTGWWAKVVERMVPEREPSMTRFLSKLSASTGSVAAEAARRSLAEVLRRVARAAETSIRRGTPPSHNQERLFVECDAALDEVRRFIFAMAQQAQSPREVRGGSSLAHACDHLRRLLRALRELTPPARWAQGPGMEDLARAAELALDVLDLAAREGDPDPGTRAKVRATAEALAELRREGRLRLLDAAAQGELEPLAAVRRTEALLRLDRVSYHVWRALEHLAPPGREGAAEEGDGDAEAADESDPERAEATGAE